MDKMCNEDDKMANSTNNNNNLESTRTTFNSYIIKKKEEEVEKYQHDGEGLLAFEQQPRNSFELKLKELLLFFKNGLAFDELNYGRGRNGDQFKHATHK